MDIHVVQGDPAGLHRQQPARSQAALNQLVKLTGKQPVRRAVRVWLSEIAVDNIKLPVSVTYIPPGVLA